MKTFWVVALLILLSAISVSTGNAPISPKVSGTKEAYATLYYGSGLGEAIRIMGKAIKATNTTRDLLLLVTPDVSETDRETAVSSGWIVKEVEPIAHPYANAESRFKFVFTKLRFWQQIEYRRIVFLDADILVTDNVDELFKCGPFCAAMSSPLHFNGGVLIIQPSLMEFDSLMKFIEDNPDKIDAMGEQTLLNLYYGPEMRNNREFVETQEQENDHPQRIPFQYNANSDHYSFYGKWKTPNKKVKLIHYSKPYDKPWLWFVFPFKAITAEYLIYYEDHVFESLLAVLFCAIPTACILKGVKLPPQLNLSRTPVTVSLFGSLLLIYTMTPNFVRPHIAWTLVIGVFVLLRLGIREVDFLSLSELCHLLVLSLFHVLCSWTMTDTGRTLIVYLIIFAIGAVSFRLFEWLMFAPQKPGAFQDTLLRLRFPIMEMVISPSKRNGQIATMTVVSFSILVVLVYTYPW